VLFVTQEFAIFFIFLFFAMFFFTIVSDKISLSLREKAQLRSGDASRFIYCDVTCKRGIKIQTISTV